jgi:hypothetical protein
LNSAIASLTPLPLRLSLQLKVDAQLSDLPLDPGGRSTTAASI